MEWRSFHATNRSAGRTSLPCFQEQYLTISGLANRNSVQTKCKDRNFVDFFFHFVAFVASVSQLPQHGRQRRDAENRKDAFVDVLIHADLMTFERICQIFFIIYTPIISCFTIIENRFTKVYSTNIEKNGIKFTGGNLIRSI